MSHPQPLLRLPNSITWPTAPRPVFPVRDHPSVRGGKLVSAQAMRSGGHHAALDVLTAGDYFQVVRVYAIPNTAQMVNDESFRDSPQVRLIKPAVGKMALSAALEPPIATLVKRSAPEPTGSGTLDKHFGIWAARSASRPDYKHGLAPSLPMQKAHPPGFVRAFATINRTQSFHGLSIQLNCGWYDATSSRWRAV